MSHAISGIGGSGGSGVFSEFMGGLSGEGIWESSYSSEARRSYITKFLQPVFDIREGAEDT
jgi:hypothetical protein